MVSGSGLDAQLGAKFETAYGTPVTVDRFWDFDSESIVPNPTFREPSGLRPGRRFKRGSKLAQTRQMYGGDVNLQFGSRDMGFWLKLLMSSSVTTPTVITGTAFKQVHQFGQSVFPQFATVQVGRPEPESGTVQPHTFSGCVATGGEISVSDGETFNLQVSLDARSEATATALAAASIATPANVFDFQDATVFKLGGTASTTSGLVSIASGVQVPTVVTELSLKIDNSLALERYGLGNAGLKNGPRFNDFVPITGSMTAEYDRTTLYTPFKNGTSMPLQLSAIGPQIAATGSFETLDLIAAKILFKNVGPQVGGPDLVTQTVEFEVYDDDVNAPFQATIISADSTAL